MKNTKKLIRQKKWENKQFDMISEDLIEKTKYFQLLRVTKQLQELIKGGDEDQHAAELIRLEKRMSHGLKAHESKIEEKKKLFGSINKKINEKATENNDLKKHLGDLKAAVQERQKILNIQASRKMYGNTMGSPTSKT